MDQKEEKAIVYFNPEERIVVLIDGINLTSTMKSLGFDIDYKKLLALFRSKGRLIRALFYTTVFDQDDYSSVRPLVDWLEYNGYTLVTKPAKEFVDATGRRRLRGNMNVEIAVDAMRLASSADHIVLFTGEGNFRSLVATLQDLGVRVTVISTLQTRPAMVADELRRQADQFVDLAELESMIGRIRLPKPEPEMPIEDDMSNGEQSSQADEELESLPEERPARAPAVVERRTRTRSPAR